eukprot:2863611-Rhodomonas_salina.1
MLEFIFGTRGSVLEPEAQAHLQELCIDNKHHHNILGAGVLAAIAGLATMSDARTAEKHLYPPRSGQGGAGNLPGQRDARRGGRAGGNMGVLTVNHPPLQGLHWRSVSARQEWVPDLRGSGENTDRQYSSGGQQGHLLTGGKVALLPLDLEG